MWRQRVVSTYLLSFHWFVMTENDRAWQSMTKSNLGGMCILLIWPLVLMMNGTQSWAFEFFLLMQKAAVFDDYQSLVCTTFMMHMTLHLSWASWMTIRISNIDLLRKLYEILLQAALSDLACSWHLDCR